MATIAREKNGTVRIWFVDPAGKRKGVRIGKVSDSDADRFKLRVEDLVTAAFNDARAKADQVSNEEMAKMSQGLPLPPGFKLPFG